MEPSEANDFAHNGQIWKESPYNAIHIIVMTSEWNQRFEIIVLLYIHASVPKEIDSASWTVTFYGVLGKQMIDLGK